LFREKYYFARYFISHAMILIYFDYNEKNSLWETHFFTLKELKKKTHALVITAFGIVHQKAATGVAYLSDLNAKGNIHVFALDIQHVHELHQAVLMVMLLCCGARKAQDINHTQSSAWLATLTQRIWEQN
jgi:hypothetical protein